MKKHILTIILVLLCMANAWAQEPNRAQHQGETFELNSQLPNGEDNDYSASNYIMLSPGFSSEPESANHSLLQTGLDPFQIYPPQSGLTGSEGTVVGTLGGTIDVGSLGGLIYSIPIDVPAGINGMQPNLSVTYNSQGGNGLMGWGWDLSGISCITRTGQTLYHDGKMTAADLSQDDRFVLDGQRLINVRGDYGNSHTEYRTENDAFMKIVGYENPTSYFIVQDIDGNKIEYGRTPNSKLTAGAYAINWMISSISDTYGNSISYQYEKNDESGEIKIKYIDYTINEGQGVKAQFRVEFNYMPNRKDSEWHFISNYQLLYRDLLTGISIKSIETDKALAKYRFDYTYDTERQYNVLDAVTKQLFDGSETVESEIHTTINWNSYSYFIPGHWEGSNWINDCYTQIQDNEITDDSFLDEFPFKGDFNGDGYTDLAMIPYKCLVESNDDETYHYYEEKPNLKIYLNNRDGTFRHEARMDLNNLSTSLDWVYVFDINGDGLDDIVTYYADTLPDHGEEMTTIILYQNEGNSFERIHTFTTYTKGTVLLGDFNGNGTSDLLFFSKRIDYHKRFKTDGGLVCHEDAPYFTNAHLMYFSDDGQFHFDHLNRSSLKRQLGYVFDATAADFDGDGTTEVVFIRYVNDAPSTLCKVDLGDQDMPFKTTFTFDEIRHELFYGGHGDTWCFTFPGDFNGDGKSDLLYFKYSRWRILYSKGTDFSWSALERFSLPDLYFGYNIFYPSLSIVIPRSGGHVATLVVDDFDGDGCSDVVYLNQNSTTKLKIVSRPWGGVFRKRLNATSTHSFRTQYIHTGNFLGNDNVSLLSTKPFSGGSKSDGAYITTIKSVSNYNSVTSITDNMGNVTSFAYECLAPPSESQESPFYTYQYAAPDANDIRPTPMMQRALRTVTVAGPGGSSTITRYSYRNARLHKKGHGVIGFDGVTTETFRNSITEDGWRTRHMTWNECRTMGSLAMMLPQWENTYVNKNGAAEAISRTEYDFNNVAFANANKVVCPAMISKKEETYSIDGDDELQKITKTGYEYDFNQATNTYRNSYSCTKTTQVVIGYDHGRATTELEAVTNSLRSSYTDDGNWILNRPDEETVIATRNGEEVASKTIYDYDSDDSYAPSFVTVIPNNGEQPNDPLTTQTQYDYDAFGNTTGVTVSAPYGVQQEEPRIVAYEFGDEYQHRLLTKEVHGEPSDGYVTKYTYDFRDQLKSVTDCNDMTVEYATTSNGNSQHIHNFDETEQIGLVLWAERNTPYKPEGATYYTWGKKTGGVTSMTFFHKTGAELRNVSFDFNGTPIFTDKEYGPDGLLCRESAPYAQGSEEIKWTYFKYDPFDRVKDISYPDGSSTNFDYDGLTTTTTQFPSPSSLQVNPQKNQQTLNALGLVKQNIDSYELPEAEHIIVNYEYYPDGKLQSACIGNDEATKIWLEYDNAGNRTILHDPDYSTETNDLVSVYDAFGQEVSRTTPKQLTSTYQYDKFGRMTNRTEQEEDNGNIIEVGTQWEYYEDGGKKGLLESVTYPGETLTYSYDEYQRLESLTTDYGNDEIFATSYTYDEASRTKTVEYPSKVSVQYLYNSIGYLKGYADMGGNPLFTTNDVNDMGQITKYTLGNNIVSQRQYHPEKHLLSDINTTARGNILQNLHYDYDGFSNLAARTDNLRNMTEGFKYDQLNRLTEIYLNPELNPEPTGVMSYDDFGRMTSKTADGQLVFTRTVYDETSKPHALDRADVNLELFPEERQEISYTSFDKVKRIVQGDNTLAYTYGYDHQRIRMEEHANGTTRTKLYVGNCEYVTETTTDATTERWLTYLIGPSGAYAVVTTENNEESLHYILKDHLGSWTTITDAEGNIEQELSFDAWGNLRNPETWMNYLEGDGHEMPMFDRGYTGHEHLYSFGLINMNGRMYDPVMSLFLSVDAYVQSPDNSQNFNRYAYCLNNPLRYTDPTGWFYQGGHSGSSLQGPYECQWNAPERRTIDPSIAMDFIGVWATFWEGNELKNEGGGGNETPVNDWFVNENTGAVYYNNKMTKGDEGKGEMVGPGWNWLGPNGMFNKFNPNFLGEEISLMARLKGKIKITSADIDISLLLSGDDAQKVMENLGYQQVATQVIEYNDTYEQVADGPGGSRFHITYGTSIEYTEKVTYVPNDYVEINRVCQGTLYGDYNILVNSTPYVSRFSITYGEASFLRKVGEVLKIGVGIHDYTNYFNGGSIINGYNGNNQLIKDFLNTRP